MNGPIFTVIRRVAMLILLVLILARPGFGTVPGQVRVNDVEVTIVLDRTRSMAALDYAGEQPRIAGAQADVAEIAAALPGSRFSLITWASVVHTELPYTTDTTALASAMETISIEPPEYGSGSSVSRPLAELAKVLAQSERQASDRTRLVFFLSDGENTSQEEQRSYQQLADVVDGGAVLGYGTEQGARMPEADDLSLADGYVTNPSDFGDAISRYDPANLQQVADELGVPFLHRTGPGDLDRLVDQVSQEASGVADEGRRKRELTWLFALVLFGLGLFEWYTVWNGLAQVRRIRR